ARATRAGGPRRAEAMDQRVQDRARPLGLIRLQAVGRPLLDRAVEVQDRLRRVTRRPPGQRTAEGLLEAIGLREQWRALLGCGSIGRSRRTGVIGGARRGGGLRRGGLSPPKGPAAREG